MRFRNLWAIALLTFLSAPVTAQRSSEKLKPRWIRQVPEPSNSTFIYTTESAYASSLEDAREKCFAQLVAHTGLQKGVMILSDNRTEERLSQIFDDGRLTERIEYEGKTTTDTRFDAAKIYVEHIDEYWKRDRLGNYYVIKLYARSEVDREAVFDDVQLTTRYGARGLWRSAIVPGWGQFHKGSNLKGGLLLGGAAILAAGIVLTENQRSDYMGKIGRTHDINLIRSYTTKADHFATARNVCIGAAAALYLYNLIDAVAAPGARRVVSRPHSVHAHYSYGVAPMVTTDGSTGLQATLTF